MDSKYCEECKGECKQFNRSLDDKIDDGFFYIINKIKLIFLYCLCMRKIEEKDF
jgi:hypothetical protein